MKNKLIIISLLSVSLVTCTFIGITKVFADNTNKTLPNSNKNMPEGVTWNPERKEYYDSKNFVWDPQKKCYIPILKYSNQNINQKTNTVEEQKQWLLKKQNSTNNIDKSIIEFQKKYEEELSKDPALKVSSKAIYTNDPAYDVFLNLSINDLSEILTRISSDDVWSQLLKNVTIKITKLQDTSLSIDDNSKWLQNFNTKITSIQPKIKDYSEKLKNGVDNETQTKIDTDIQSCGIFAVPYLMDEIDKGNDKMINYLPSLLDTYSNASKEDLLKKDKTYWQNWSQSHKNDLDILRKLTKGN